MTGKDTQKIFKFKNYLWKQTSISSSLFQMFYVCKKRKYFSTNDNTTPVNS